MPTSTLRQLFEQNLMEIYFVELKMIESLAEQAAEAMDDGLRSALETHQQQTQQQVLRLEAAFAAIKIKPQTTVCEGFEGVLREKQDFEQEDPLPMLRDVFLVGLARKIEHYEISAYEGLVEAAEVLGLQKARQFLLENLQEERDTLQKLSELSRQLTSHLAGGAA